MDYKRINTYKGKEVIGTNYQNIKTGEVISEDEMKDLLIGNCDWCYSSGYLESFGEKIKCPHCDLENYSDVLDIWIK